MRYTIGIVTWCRDEEAARAVGSAVKAAREDTEVLVLDGSQGGAIGRRLLAAFPQIRVIRSPRNLGCPDARNFLLANSEGEVIVHVDDDAVVDPSILDKLDVAFALGDDIAVVACNILDFSDDRPLTDEVRETTEFRGCCAMRVSSVQAVGYYPNDFMRQAEERHLALRLIDSGFRIVYADGAVIRHQRSPLGRSDGETYFYGCRNDLQTIAELAPAHLVLPLLVQKVCRYAIHGIRVRAIGSVLLGTAAFLTRWPRIVLRSRRPVGWNAWRRVLRIGAARPVTPEAPPEEVGS